MPKPLLGVLRSRAGVSLTELMIAVAVLSVAIVGLVGSFASVQTALQLSKNKTLAANLAQEKMQILKQKSYYQVLVTVNPDYEVLPSTSIPYDPTYFPAESILEGGVRYKRMTYVQVAREDSGSITLLPPSTPDTGMRLITISVSWREGREQKHLSIRSIMGNPDTVMSNSIFSGTVLENGTMTPIVGALINVAENLGWRDTSGAGGNYQINLSPGNYTLVASANGYFTAVRQLSVAANQTVDADWSMVKMASGTATGTAWMNPDLVISQVVVSTPQIQLTGSFAAEYFELFNPTLSTITVSSYNLNVQAPPGCTATVTCNNIPIDYVRTEVGPGKYFVIANTTTFTVNGATVTADAVIRDTADTACTVAPNSSIWQPNDAVAPRKMFWASAAGSGHGGSVWLTNASGTPVDTVAWSHAAQTVTGHIEGTALTLATGFGEGIQLIRTSSPNVVSNTLGRAYDADINNVDLTTVTLSYFAYDSLGSSFSIVTGKPAVGAVVTATDGLSDSTAAVRVGSPPTAVFSLTQVATGTWTMLVSSGVWALQHDTVTVAATGSVWVLPTTMTYLNQANTAGFISGTVTDALGVAISAPVPVPVSPGSAGIQVNANTTNGRYLLRVSTGLVDVTANVNNGNNLYVSMSSIAIPVALGQIVNGVDFRLSQGGRIQAFITRDGVNALPGVAVTAIDINNVARDTQVSGTDGRFTTINIATGVYSVTPIVDSIETSTPTEISVTVNSGQTVFAGTFTITGALGTINGTVKLGTLPISTGVLLVASTAVLTGTPPALPSLSTATLSGTPYYVASSKEDGTYQLEVRGSTNPTYRVYAYYTTLTSTGAVTINGQTQTGVGVLPGQSVTGYDFTW